MPQAISLHIGLNYVDPNAYDGWDGALSGCINDANAMKRIADSQGFSSQTLIDNQATAASVTNAIAAIARRLVSGDFFLLTYSGHGGQLVDNTGEEVDGLNETWVLWDRQFSDNEVYNLLSQFAAGVRIFVSSDSCHSGTVIRAFLRAMKQKKNTDVKKLNYITEFDKFVNSTTREFPVANLKNVRNIITPSTNAVRAMPEFLCMSNYEKNKDTYDAIRSMTGNKEARANDINASVIFISGCADNQYSYDGAVNGAFTTALLQIWNNGGYSGNYPSFRNQINDRMNNREQIPQYMKLGPVLADFENAKPYVVGTASGSSGSTGSTGGSSSSVNPSMSTASPVNRNGATPIFQVNKGANPYYYVELATDASLFAYGNTSRNDSNWFATWGDRMTASTWQMPANAWNNLKNAQRIYYRIGSTSSSVVGQWDNWKVSFADTQISSAPFIELQSAGTGSGDTGSGGTGTGDVLVNPSSTLTASVGAGGVNRREDVSLIQQLLNEINDADGGSVLSPLNVDGQYGTQTLNAIRRFQTRQEFVNSGLVKQNSSCLHMLLNKSGREQ